MRITERFTQKLLVEGNDDQHVVRALRNRFDVAESFDIVDCEGLEKLLEQIPIRFKQSGITAIGIIVDADADINARWASVKATFALQGYNVPDELPADGLVATNENGIRAGVWIMPNNNLAGMLEDFLAFLVPGEDELLPVAESILTDIETRQLNKYNAVHKIKAKIHTWLAWQEEPGTPLGLSITKRYLSAEPGVCQSFVNWLNRLFNTGAR
jgi:hypothetical protein